MKDRWKSTRNRRNETSLQRKEVARLEAASRDERVLFHATNQRRANRIMKMQKMLPGGWGAAGGGIYFAETANDARQKANNKNKLVVLQARVFLGRSLVIDHKARWRSDSITFERLRELGFDSTRVLRRSSKPEWVVYSSTQVADIRYYDSTPRR